MSHTDLQIVTQTRLPTRFGQFIMTGFSTFADGREHVAMVHGDVAGKRDVLVRMHSECLTGDVFGSKRCDCGDQLEMAMKRIADAGAGIVLYLRQEGRGIGLSNKLRAYALQDGGMDTVEANVALGLAADARDFAPAVHMLRALNVDGIRLMTNNPCKCDALVAAGFDVKRVGHVSCISAENADYMRVKAEKLGHILPVRNDDAA